MNFEKFIITITGNQNRINNLEKFYKDRFSEFILFYGLEKDAIKNNKSKITNLYCSKICTIGIIGCASSHILLWGEICKNFNDRTFIIITEDDTYIDLNKINLSSINKLLSINPYIFLQLTGQGIIKEKNYKFLDLKLQKYKFHFFLGAYIITPKIASILYKYFTSNKISYHIDYMLNAAYKKLNIFPLILINNYSQQKGLNDSSMNFNLNSRCYTNKNQDMFYALNLPILKFGDIIINFIFIFYVILLIFNLLMENFFFCIIIGILFFESIKFDL